MGQNPVSIPVMYSNGYIPAHGVEDNRKNPWVLATQTGYKEIWNNRFRQIFLWSKSWTSLPKAYA